MSTTSKRGELSDEAVRRMFRQAVDDEATSKLGGAAEDEYPRLLFILAQPLPLERIAAEAGLAAALPETMRRLEFEVDTRFPQLIAQAEADVARLIDAASWQIVISPPSPTAPVTSLAFAAPDGPRQLTLVSSPGVSGPVVELHIQELERDGNWITRFDCVPDSDAPFHEIRWRLFFDPELEHEVLTVRLGIAAEHLGRLRLHHGENAWTALLDRLIPCRSGTLRAGDVLSTLRQGRLPGTPVAYELSVVESP